VSPYIVTTKRRGYMGLGLVRSPRVVSRRAVATLEEANEAVHRIVHDLPGKWQITTLAKCTPLPDSGGTVGPLPDGTVIEVEQISWDDLRDQCPEHLPRAEGQTRQAAILDAYNARQA
jgi:hypothetical protein